MGILRRFLKEDQSTIEEVCELCIQCKLMTCKYFKPLYNSVVHLFTQPIPNVCEIKCVSCLRRMFLDTPQPSKLKITS